tara:strand:- start:8 stop:781 length:774 start_codon:yes stop_codon:yes gene_type:complete
MDNDLNGEPRIVSIRLEKIQKQLGTQHVLRGVDLDIFSGETMVLIGASGGGKSVILKHITGLMRPDSGRVIIGKQDISQLNERGLAVIRQKVGVLFQNGALFDSMSVGQNVAFPLRERGEKNITTLTEKVTEALRLVGLEEHINKMPNALSGGMRKRVALARAMIAKPESILYDEPTAGLDPVSTGSIDSLIIQMQKDYGITSVVVTHDMKSARTIADRIAFLRKGSVYFCGTPEEMDASDDPVIHDFINGHPAEEL